MDHDSYLGQAAFTESQVTCNGLTVICKSAVPILYISQNLVAQLDLSAACKQRGCILVWSSNSCIACVTLTSCNVKAAAKTLLCPADWHQQIRSCLLHDSSWRWCRWRQRLAAAVVTSTLVACKAINSLWAAMLMIMLLLHAWSTSCLSLNPDVTEPSQKVLLLACQGLLSSLLHSTWNWAVQLDGGAKMAQQNSITWWTPLYCTASTQKGQSCHRRMCVYSYACSRFAFVQARIPIH